MPQVARSPVSAWMRVARCMRCGRAARGERCACGCDFTVRRPRSYLQMEGFVPAASEAPQEARRRRSRAAAAAAAGILGACAMLLFVA